MSELTLGQKRVGKTFNPSGNKNVDKIKELAAEAIDLLEVLRNYPQPNGDVGSLSKPSESQRVISVAQTAFEEASMWGVKANFVE